MIALKVLNTYRLLPLKVITEYSLMASILTLIKRNFVELSWTEQITLIESYGKQTPSDITKLLGINIIIWSANQIELFCHEVGKYDHPTILIFQNKYGQYYPIVNNSNIHELNNSPLLLKLLSIHFMKLDTK